MSYGLNMKNIKFKTDWDGDSRVFMIFSPFRVANEEIFYNLNIYNCDFIANVGSYFSYVVISLEDEKR